MRAARGSIFWFAMSLALGLASNAAATPRLAIGAAQVVLQPQVADRNAEDELGSTVAVDADTAVLGAPGDDGAGTGAGAAYVFVRNGNTWQPHSDVASQKLTGPAGVVGFGRVLALSGSALLVGAPGRGQDGDPVGRAYVFRRAANGTWGSRVELAPASTLATDRYAEAVAISGNTALVGARGDSANSGAVYVFLFNGTTWAQQAKLVVAPAVTEEENFGASVAIEGDRAIIGAPGLGDPTTNEDAGGAYAFLRTGTSWSAGLSLGPGALPVWQSGTSFGRSVALSGDWALIGMDAGGPGFAYFFRFVGAAWVAQQRFNAAAPASADSFGKAVSILGTRAIIGAEQANTGRGTVQLFSLSGSSWARETPVLSGSASETFFGGAVAISSTAALAGAVEELCSGGAAPCGAGFISPVADAPASAQAVPALGRASFYALALLLAAGGALLALRRRPSALA